MMSYVPAIMARHIAHHIFETSAHEESVSLE